MIRARAWLRRYALTVGARTLPLAALVAACGSSRASDPAPSERPDEVGGHSAVGDAGVGGGPLRADYGLLERPRNPACKAGPPPVVSAEAVFEEVFQGRVLGLAPMMMAQPPGDRSRWFVATRAGQLRSFEVDRPEAPVREVVTLAAVSGLPIQTGGEGGFLGFAFHPRFASNGRVYVSWTTADAPSGFRSRVGFLTSADGGTTFSSYTNIIDFEQPNSNHKGGGIAFGPDGLLYLSFGDGGANFEGNGQVRTGFFSKILRIDVDAPPTGSLPYAIPATNPFSSDPTAEPATLAYGFRNPFRFSIDPVTSEVWVGDVGHAKWEEVDVVSPGGNYGWPCREGLIDYWGKHPIFCPLGVENLQDPLVMHEHVAGTSTTRSITGGVVYRGKAVPGLVGSYVHGDFATGELFALSYDPVDGSPRSRVLNGAGPTGGWVHFAEDAAHEIYALDLFGHIYAMLPVTASQPLTVPARLSQTGCVAPSDPTQPAEGLIHYDVNVDFWSDGATKDRFLAIPDGQVIGLSGEKLVLPPGSVVMKTFRSGETPIETRLLMRHDDGAWAGYSYEWLADGSDAVLLPAGKRKDGQQQSWSYPSRAQCIRCHTAAAGRVLGLELGQLERDSVYPSTNRIANQLATFRHIGVLTGEGSPARALSSTASQAPLELRARDYLHVNCAGCHRPGGEPSTRMDLRASTSLLEMHVCDEPPERGDLGVGGARLLSPSQPSTSLLSLRARSLGVGRMPPIASHRVDEEGLAVVDAWIASLTGCPSK